MSCLRTSAFASAADVADRLNSSQLLRDRPAGLRRENSLIKRKINTRGTGRGGETYIKKKRKKKGQSPWNYFHRPVFRVIVIDYVIRWARFCAIIFI